MFPNVTVKEQVMFHTVLKTEVPLRSGPVRRIAFSFFEKTGHQRTSKEMQRTEKVTTANQSFLDTPPCYSSTMRCFRSWAV